MNGHVTSFSFRCAMVDHQASASCGYAATARRQAVYAGSSSADRTLLVLRTGIQWEVLPDKIECESGITCSQRLRDWQGRRLGQPAPLAAPQASGG